MRNQGTILGIAISLLVTSIVFIYVTYVYIPNVKKQAEDKITFKYVQCKVLVVDKENGLPEGTLITDDLFTDGSIKIQSMPKIYLPYTLINPTLPNDENNKQYLAINIAESQDDSLLKSQILNKSLTTKLVRGMIITKSSIQNEEVSKIDHSKRDLQINVENSAGDLLKQGKYVDIIVKYENGEYDIVIPKMYVDKVIVAADDSEQAQQATTVNQATIQIAVNERQYRDLELAKRFGSISIRLYSDSNQYAALQTFNYEEKIAFVNQVLQREEADDSITGEHEEYFKELAMYIDGSKKDIVLDTENYIKLQEYSDIYYNQIEKLIDNKTIKEKSLLDEYMLYLAIQKILTKSNVDISNMTKEDILNYDFTTSVERRNVIEEIRNLTDEEKLSALEMNARDSLMKMTVQELIDFATKNSLNNMRIMLSTDNGVDEKTKKENVLKETPIKDLLEAFYKTETQTLKDVQNKILKQYSRDVISLKEIKYVTELEISDIIIALILGNKYIDNDAQMTRVGLYETYSTNYKSALDTRKITADNIVNHAVLFYQTHGTKIDSIAYLIRNDLYYQYIK